MTYRALFLPAATVLFAGCGWGTVSPMMVGPDHVLAANAAASVPRNNGWYGFKFSLPVAASLDFRVDPASTGTGGQFTVAVYSGAQWPQKMQGSTDLAAGGGLHAMVYSAVDAVSLAAGDWVLGVRCDSYAADCSLLVSLDAIY